MQYWGFISRRERIHVANESMTGGSNPQPYMLQGGFTLKHKYTLGRGVIMGRCAAKSSTAKSSTAKAAKHFSQLLIASYHDAHVLVATSSFC